MVVLFAHPATVQRERPKAIYGEQFSAECTRTYLRLSGGRVLAGIPKKGDIPDAYSFVK
jgi:hypothetical protein